ncbi:MAG: class I tRNA ligase family protein, partial [Paludibacteraceae bacterium]|nr:class I tRNA ligase family protein [Paludibacteraceae bacterium]
LIEMVEDYNNKVGYSERTNVFIEPKLSMQWFLKMEHLAQIALKPVMDDDIKFYPPKYKNTYRHWMENIKDWCISRQLWWGHRIPAYYLPGGGFVVAESEAEALEKAKAKTGNPALTAADLRQDEDCLDTWFSSWLWPISLFDGINRPGNDEIKYYYPTADLVTGPDIIFFWVARMIMAGYEYQGTMPFKNVYFTGIVRDKIGRKMSKSLGNSPDPLELIERFGADGVRMGMMLSAPAGNDILFDEALCEQGRNFNNKIWNAFRLVKGWQQADTAQPEVNALAVKWFTSKLNKSVAEINDLFSKYRISEALMEVYRLFWDDFSSWYLEMVKPAYGSPIDQATYSATIGFFDALLRLLHPFMPFITEELWQAIETRRAGESIMVMPMPQAGPVDEALLETVQVAQNVIAGVRSQRLSRNIPAKETLELHFMGAHNGAMDALIVKMANVSAIASVSEAGAADASFMVGATKYLLPLDGQINVEEEIKKCQAQIEHLEGLLKGVNAKLGNERFMANAKPDVIEREQKKKSDSEEKIAALQATIAQLRK